jgi:two-component system, cell cycle sensor histidine kinase and response regulator CckA
MNNDGESTAARIASAIFDLAPIAIEIYDAQGELLKANQKSREMFGDQGLLRVQGYGLMEGPDLSLEGRAAVQQGRLIRYQTLVDFDAAKALGRCTSAATGKVYLNVIIEPLREQPNQAVTNYIVLSEDVSERVQAELSLRESEERFRTVFEEGHIGLVLVDRRGRFMRTNPSFCEMVGYSEAELLKMTFGEVTHPDHRASDLENVKKVARGELDVYQAEKRYLRKDGQVVWGAITVSAVRSDRGELLYFLSTVQDISERRQAEAALAAGKRQVHEALQRLDLAIKSAHLGVWDWNIPNNQMVWDDEMLNMYGYTRESFPGCIEAWQNGVHPDDRQRALAEFQAALDGIRPYDTIFRIIRSNGEVRTIKADGLVLRDERQAPARMLGLNRDITEETSNEAALRENETIFSTFLEHCPVHVFFKDNQARALRLSRSFESMLGRPIEEALGKPMDELFPLELAKSMVADDMRILREGRRVHVTEQLGDCIYETTKFPIFVDGKAVMLAGFTIDITERKKAEEERAKLQEQLNQAQKMESVGRLAGGVAHDFNNMLGVMLGNIELALDHLDPGNPVATNLHEIHKAARRSADLTRQLLAFARKQTISPKVLDLNETVDGMLNMLRRLVGENIQLDWSPGEGLASVHMDPTQIHQILANLCVNARDAIKDVGHIRITTSRIRVDPEDCQHNVDALPGEYVLLAVSDDGSGMDRATISKLFEPFFTTKELGRGTGLGLSTVHGIVKQNRGYITVYSEVGRGSVFHVYLPAHQTSPQKAFVSGEAPLCPGGCEPILLVEDEEPLLQMSQRMLEGLGYRVLCAATPDEAIRLAKEHGRDMHLLVTDMVMPGMNGRDLAEALRVACPHVKCLYVSGYSAEVVGRQHVIEEGAAFLQKPFLRSELAAALRRLLDPAPG